MVGPARCHDAGGVAVPPGPAGGIVLAVAALGVAALFVRGKIDEDRHRAQAHGLVRRLLDADTVQVPSVVAELASYRRWADPELRRAVADPVDVARPAPARADALLPADASSSPGPVRGDVGSRSRRVPHRVRRPPAVTDRSGPPALAGGGIPRPPGRPVLPGGRRAGELRPGERRWAGRAGPMVRQLAAQPSLLVPAWVEMLRPVGGRLVPALADRLRDRAEDDRSSHRSSPATPRTGISSWPNSSAMPGRRSSRCCWRRSGRRGRAPPRRWMRPSPGSSRPTGPMRRT